MQLARSGIFMDVLSLCVHGVLATTLQIPAFKK